MKKNIDNRHSAKKATVLKPRHSKKKLKVIVLFIAFSALITTAIVLYSGKKTTLLSNNVSTTPQESSQVRYPINMFADGKAHHFDFKTDGLTIRYFILKSSDGIIRAAFDACDVCWPAGKGYFQDGDKMVCRNCGRRFASVLVNEVKGGCNPAPLKRKVEGEELILEVKDIRQGKSYFDFEGKA